MSIAFFLSREGDLITVPDNHIGTVIADPERFGLTTAQIGAAYLHHKEPMGVEGKARREILLRIIADGWIRIRRYRNYWSVTAPSLAPQVQGTLRVWAKTMLSGANGFREVDRYMPVKISTIEGESRYTIVDLVDGSCPR